MTPSQIITKEAQTIGGDADVVLRKVNKLVQSKAAILLQKNDTLLLLISIAKGMVELHIFTADRPARVVEAMKYFVEKIKDSDIKSVYGSGNTTQDAKLKKTLDVLDRLGVDIQKSNMPGYQWMATVEGSK
jgi:coenzyme F420-reducing hydrogenase delta subunit